MFAFLPTQKLDHTGGAWRLPAVAAAAAEPLPLAAGAGRARGLSPPPPPPEEAEAVSGAAEAEGIGAGTLPGMVAAVEEEEAVSGAVEKLLPPAALLMVSTGAGPSCRGWYEMRGVSIVQDTAR